MGKLIRSRVLRGGVEMGQENFPCHARRGGDEVRQNHAGRGQKPHPSDLLHLIAIPSEQWLLTFTFYLLTFSDILFNRKGKRKRAHERRKCSSENEAVFILHRLLNLYHCLSLSPPLTTCSPYRSDESDLLFIYLFIFIFKFVMITLVLRETLCFVIWHAKFFLLFKFFDFVGWTVFCLLSFSLWEETERGCGKKKWRKKEKKLI